jgi:hypothetical protein
MFPNFTRTMFDSCVSLACIVMAPRGRKPSSSTSGSLRIVRAVVAAVKFYWEFVLEEDKATMSVLEAEVRMVREFKYDKNVEHQVDGLILDLGYTRMWNLNFL